MAAIDKNEDIREREKIARAIVKTSESIRKKHRALKTGKIEEDIVLDRRFRPLIEPLQKIVDNSSSIAVKNEPASNTDAGIEALSIPKREKDDDDDDDDDVTPQKRKRSNVRSDRSPTPHKSKRLDAPLDVPLITYTPSASMRTIQPTMPELFRSQDVFETTDDSLITSVRNQLQTPEGQETLRDQLGPLGQRYIWPILSGDQESGIDNVYGVYLDKNGMMFGNKRFDVDNADSIIIDGIRYVGTPGLYELIFKKFPDDVIYTEDDKQTYKSMLLTTSAHKRNHDAHGRLLSNRGYKYKEIIAKLIPIEPKRTKSGKGLFAPRKMTLTDNKIDYVHWDDPNELVDRLRLLDASHQAGHNGHDNEILSIIEELREAGIIIN
ncbi:uncharacterized protein [Polyergus mexicanus]|uniref:uncharacterized protein n=1 Tax=Polyergus mexicanus TaxID=615972 RepID=UPI0038B51474